MQQMIPDDDYSRYFLWTPTLCVILLSLGLNLDKKLLLIQVFDDRCIHAVLDPVSAGMCLSRT